MYLAHYRRGPNLAAVQEIFVNGTNERRETREGRSFYKEQSLRSDIYGEISFFCHPFQRLKTNYPSVLFGVKFELDKKTDFMLATRVY